MVKFFAIGILDDQDWLYGFESLKLFDDFRKSIWRDHPGGISYLCQWVSQNSLERRAEGAYRLTPRSLDGACLIFGSREETSGQLVNPVVRDILTDPASEAVLRVCLAEGTVHSRVTRGEENYVASYPISQVLIPEGTSVRDKYHHFLVGRVWEVAGRNLMVRDEELAPEEDVIMAQARH